MLHPRMPQRIQQKRTKGWRKPDGAVSVTRPGHLGNPFTIKAVLAAGLADTEPAARQLAGCAFEAWLPGGHEPEGLLLVDGTAKSKLRRGALHRILGHDLMCWCRLDQPCHGDVSLPYARRVAAL